jgi:hypothetical protein
LVARFLAILVALMVALPAWAATVELRLDAADMSVGQTIGMAIRIVDGTPTAVPQVKVPEGLQISYHAQQSSSYFDLGRRASRRITEYQYRLTALKEGSYTLGPIPVELGADMTATNSKTLTVTARAEEQKTPIAATAAFDRTDAWEGEVVVYRYELRSRVELLSAQWNLPDFDGFVAPRDGDRPRRQYTIEDDSGATVVDETAIPLVATGTGKREVPGAVVRVDVPADEGTTRKRRSPFDEMFGLRPTRSEVLATAPSEIVVQKLPPAPKGFTGLVGDFTMESRVSEDRAPVGASIEWTVRIQGDGSLEGFEMPPLPESDAWRAYDSGPSVHARVVDGKYVATGEFHRVLVPTKEGRLQVPPIEVITFSPTTGEYVTETVEVPPIDVIPGGDVDAAVRSFSEQREAAAAAPEPEDIRDVRASGPDHLPRLAALTPVAMGLAALPGTVELTRGILAWYRRRRAERERPVEVTPKDRLERLPIDPKQRLGALDATLREALARKVGVPTAALDREAAAATLPDALRAKVTEATHALDRARFADGPATAELEARVRDIVLSLEKP